MRASLHSGPLLDAIPACVVNFAAVLFTKTIWSMDLRPRMYAISVGQRAVTQGDPLAEYVPTSHVGVEIGGGAGLHHHEGTLGKLKHGVNYAMAYLRSIDRLPHAVNEAHDVLVNRADMHELTCVVMALAEAEESLTKALQDPPGAHPPSRSRWSPGSSTPAVYRSCHRCGRRRSLRRGDPTAAVSLEMRAITGCLGPAALPPASVPRPRRRQSGPREETARRGVLLPASS